MRLRRPVLLCFSALFLVLNSTRAQQPAAACQPAIPVVAPGANMFSPEQEDYLGGFLAEKIAPSMNVIEDEQLTGELQRIGKRLVENLPPTGLHFRFYLSDSPQANAFSIVGGRVYVTRKLIAVVHNEDELAGVMGHELGHIVTHQQAILFTKIFRERLGITEVSDKKDIYNKMNRLFDESAKHAPVPSSAEDNQMEADRVGLIATVRAGYSPQALADFWDRFSENKGKTGNWLTDLVGNTGRNSQRYREMAKMLSKTLGNCKEVQASNSEWFQKWQAAVIEFRGVEVKEALHNVVWRKPLNPPLQDGIHTIKFSPDGNFVLAQDNANIYVLSHEPFKTQFQIDAPGAYPAQFTPDSKEIIFYDQSLRVERWDLTSKERTGVSELYIHGDCFQTLLSPDGKMLACFRTNYTLELLDVATREAVLEKKSFVSGETGYEWGIGSFRFSFSLKFLAMGFSPDARYFVAALRGQNAVAYDLREKHEISLNGAVKNLVGIAFAFTAPDRLAGYGGENGGQSAIVEFPSGRMLQSVDLGAARPSAVAHGDYLVLRPIKDFAAGVLDVHSNQIIRANKTAALDIYGKDCVVELKNGHLGLLNTTPPAANSTPAIPIEAVLPKGYLGRLRVTTVSDDLRWLALSGSSRGGVWDLSTGGRLLNLRDFHGAYVSPGGSLLLDFPKMDAQPRSIARIGLQQKQFSEVMKPEDTHSFQDGPFLVSYRPNKQQDAGKGEAEKDEGPNSSPEGLNVHLEFSDFVRRESDVTLEVREIETGKLLWSRKFAGEAPRHYTHWRENSIVLIWRMSEPAARAELNGQPDWKRRFPTAKDSDLLIEVLDYRTGNRVNGMIFNTEEGSTRIRSAQPAGDWLIYADENRRVGVYSFSKAKEVGKVFGELETVSAGAGLVFLKTEPGKLGAYSLAKLEQKDEFAFGSDVIFAAPMADNKQLFVLTADQSTYLVETNGDAVTAAH